MESQNLMQHIAVAQIYFFLIAALIAAAVHLYRDRQPRTWGRVAEVLLLWLLVIDVGIGLVFGFKRFVSAWGSRRKGIGQRGR